MHKLFRSLGSIGQQNTSGSRSAIALLFAPSCVYGCWRERFRQRRGTIHPQGDLVSLCIHTNHICLNDTSFSMGHMKHVTQTHQHLHCVAPLGHWPPPKCARNWNKTQICMFINRLFGEGRTVAMQMFICVSTFRNAAVYNCFVSPLIWSRNVMTVNKMCQQPRTAAAIL